MPKALVLTLCSGDSTTFSTLPLSFISYSFSISPSPLSFLLTTTFLPPAIQVLVILFSLPILEIVSQPTPRVRGKWETHPTGM